MLQLLSSGRYLEVWMRLAEGGAVEREDGKQPMSRRMIIFVC